MNTVPNFGITQFMTNHDTLCYMCIYDTVSVRRFNESNRGLTSLTMKAFWRCLDTASTIYLSSKISKTITGHPRASHIETQAHCSRLELQTWQVVCKHIYRQCNTKTETRVKRTALRLCLPITHHLNQLHVCNSNKYFLRFVDGNKVEVIGLVMNN